MRLRCRIFGHKVSRSGKRIEPGSFKQVSFCKRCEAPLERNGREAWKARSVPSHSGVTSEWTAERR